MTGEKLCFTKSVTLVGGGDLDPDVLDEALVRAPHLVAADGAADRLATLGYQPEAIIGDMDSVADADAWRTAATRVLHLPEQDTTDFEKCLYSIEATGFFGVGFTGRRMDHSMAVFHAMLRYPDRKILLLSAEDAIALIPEKGIRVPVQEGARVSLVPLVPVTGVASAGLTWPIEGLEMALGQQIGTSNIANAAEIHVRFDGPGALLILDRAHAGGLAVALGLGQDSQ